MIVRALVLGGAIIVISSVTAIDPAWSQIGFHLQFTPGTPTVNRFQQQSPPQAYSYQPSPPPRPFSPANSPFPERACSAANTNEISSFPPIDCLTNKEFPTVYHMAGLSISAARPQIQNFINQVNDKLAQAKAGHRFTDQELADIRTWETNSTKVEISIGYPLNDYHPYGQSLQSMKAEETQRDIDDTFTTKGIAYLTAIDRNEMALRAQEKIASDAAAANAAREKANAATVAFEKRASGQCGGKILDLQNLAAGSPFANTGHCYSLPFIIISQWINDKTAMANLGMLPILLDFPSPPAMQYNLSEVIVRGEGAYQYHSVDGALRTIPRVRVIVQ